MSVLRRLGPLWQVQRHRRPAAAARVEEAALALRGRDALVAEVRALRSRVAELERDHLLLAAHVAVLTERLGSGEPAGPAADGEAARSRARLAAVAFYEERIGALEERLDRPAARRRRAGRASAGRPSDERLETAS